MKLFFFAMLPLKFFLRRTSENLNSTPFSRNMASSFSIMMDPQGRSVPPKSSYDGIVCDMDGVLWQGADQIHKSIDALNVIKYSGKSIVFVTNNSAKTRREIANRLSILGYDAEISDIVTSSSVTANYLRNQLNDGYFENDGERINKTPIKVFMIGNPALKEELEANDFEVVFIGDDAPAGLDEKELIQLQHNMDKSIKAVVVGVDYSFSYRKLSIAGLYIGNYERLFVATNPDNGNRIKSGGMHPETGSLVAALQSLSGKEATICGKPSSIIVDHVLNHVQNCDPCRLLMVGDRLDTDIAFANSARFSSCLVLSGVTSIEEVEDQIKKAIDPIKTPQYIAYDLWDMISPISAEEKRMLQEAKARRQETSLPII